MSDSDESGVTYTEISSIFEGLPDIGSPRVVGPEHDGLPWMPPSPYYIPGPEEPQSPPPLDYVLELVYPEFMPQKDEVFPAEEPPLPAAASPPAQSPDYVSESDPKADPEEDDDEDPEEDPVDYPSSVPNQLGSDLEFPESLFLLYYSTTITTFSSTRSPPPHRPTYSFSPLTPDTILHPLTSNLLKQTRRPRSDRGKACHSVSSSSSHHQGTSSHQHDDDDDDVKTSRASTPSPTTYLNSLGPLNYQNYQIPSASEQTMKLSLNDKPPCLTKRIRKCAEDSSHLERHQKECLARRSEDI
ncbi:hypothetical protein Tco_0474261 [Tanacetum coccineum]